ncbi:CRISPR system Cascade subunit CasB [Azospirillum fermentarium]|uniref:type I-E CRISPR-associated protein Cse2/CasB n=1 Tax=Azospirillum fermentarium TaxID=1233114 RepID=UPI002227F04B|nr:type I-E CRISPR-associated protein Cse2/CasB [Azospirillum fermentarium]MCW2247010.1 CRISPR system Cascade subunit CasB [Azospirillum fermentarium]
MTDPTDGSGPDGPVPPIARWHADLQKRKGDRAALRRAQTIDEVYVVPSFHTLLRRLGWTLSSRTPGDDEIARLAMVLADVEHDTGQPSPRWGDALGRAFGTPRKDVPKAHVSHARFRQLAATDDLDEFVRLLRGALHLIKHEAPLLDLAEVVRAWHHPARRQQVRRTLFLAYFETAPETETTDA